MDSTNDINQYLQSKILPPALYIKKYVKDEPLCNYELYLLEAINHSAYFQRLSSGNKYVSPQSESCGECDAISEKYQLDFKLAEGNSRLEANNLLNPGITKLSNGIIMWHSSKISGGTTALYLNRMLRELKTTDDIRAILSSEAEHIRFDKRSEDNIEQQGLYEIKLLAENLLMKKNLLFFLPEEFSYVDGITYSFDEAITIIGKAIEHDFSIALEFRNQENEGYDTYVCCIFNDLFLFYAYTDNQLKFVDSVSCSLCETYKYLYDNYSGWV